MPQRSDRQISLLTDSPLPWFAQLLVARDRGDFRVAAEAQEQMERLGWYLRYRRPKPIDLATQDRPGEATTR